MKRLKSWQKNLIFAAVVLAAAALLFVLYRANAPKAEPLVAVVDFGDGITETIPLDEDHDYLYDVGDYIVHLQVKDGAVAFLDSQCPWHHGCGNRRRRLQEEERPEGNQADDARALWRWRSAIGFLN